MLIQVVSVVGAILVLAAFIANQLQKLPRETLTYQLLNFVGGVALLAAAIGTRQYGFILMEGAWAVVSLWGLYALSRDISSTSL